MRLLPEAIAFSGPSARPRLDGESIFLNFNPGVLPRPQCFGGNSIWLQDTAVSDLDAEDFVFYEPPHGRRFRGGSIDGM